MSTPYHMYVQGKSKMQNQFRDQSTYGSKPEATRLPVPELRPRRWDYRSLLAACVASFLVTTPALARTYYVSPSGSDSGPGTRTSPFKTIVKGSLVANPGDIIHALPGKYPGSFVTRASGTPTARITYVSDKKWMAKIVPPAKSGNNAAWENQGNYVDIVNFEVDGTAPMSGRQWEIGIVDVGSHGRIIGNHVHHVRAPCTTNGGAGVEAYQWKGNIDGAIIGNVVHNIGDTVNGCRWVHGIYHTHTGVIANNIVYNVAGWGIHLWHRPQRVRIVNNTVTRAKSGGIVLGAERAETLNPADDMVVANNIIYDNPVGIDEQGLTGRRNQYLNNLVFKNATNWSLQNGLTHRGTITAEPRFVTYSTNGTSDFRLATGSPAIDSGNAGYAPGTDINGRERPLGSGPDLGSYEYLP